MRGNRETSRARELAERWAGPFVHYREDPMGIVLALPNDSFALASLVAGMLHIPVEVFIARDLRAPCLCPCAIGALTETCVIHMDENVIARQQWPYRELRAYIERETQVQRAEIARQRQFFRWGRELLNLGGRHVLFIDNGTVSSATWKASIESFRKLGAGKIAAALPAKSVQLIREIEHRVDELIVPTRSDLFNSPLVA